MSDVFISYARDDAAVAKKLTDNLERHGLSVFFDRAITTGENYGEVIFKELRNATSVVVLLSKHSKRSRWVEAELQTALENKGIVIPVLLDPEGKENWVWPLLADRNVIAKDPNANLKDILLKVTDAAIAASAKSRQDDKTIVSPRRTRENNEKDALPRSSVKSSWLSWIIPIITGLLGALITWLISN